MEPRNNKQLYHVCADAVFELSLQPVTAERVSAQAKMMKEICNLDLNEIRRAQTQIEVDNHNRKSDPNVVIRNLEGKPFDNIE